MQEEIKKKRSKGITFFAWFTMILYSYFFILGIVVLFHRKYYFLSDLWVIPDLAAVITGIYLLKLRNWARISIIILCSLRIIGAIIEAPMVLASMRVTSQSYRLIMIPVVLSVYVIFLTFYWAPIFFFTRSKVKEQFK